MAILIDAVSFLWSASMVGMIRKWEPESSRSAQHQSVRSDIREGLRAVLDHPVLRALAGRAATKTFFGGFYAALYGLFVIRDLHLGPAALGLAVAAGGLGDLIGAILAGRAVQRFGLGRTLIGTAVTGSWFSFLTLLAFGPTVIALSMLACAQFIGDMMRSVFEVHEMSLRQQATPDHLLGRVNASTTFLALGMLPFGALTAGLLGGLIGVRATLLIAVVGGLASALWLIHPAIRQIRSHHEAVTPLESYSVR